MAEHRSIRGIFKGESVCVCGSRDAPGRRESCLVIYFITQLWVRSLKLNPRMRYFPSPLFKLGLWRVFFWVIFSCWWGFFSPIKVKNYWNKTLINQAAWVKRQHFASLSLCLANLLFQAPPNGITAQCRESSPAQHQQLPVVLTRGKLQRSTDQMPAPKCNSWRELAPAFL